jgi:hypothetical protein
MHLCSTRDLVAKLFTRRKFLSSACKERTFHLHQSNTLLKCAGHCELKHFFVNLCGGALGTATATGLLYQPRMIGDGDCGERNEDWQRKPK